MNVFENINVVAIIVAALAYFILGALWFTPLFGKLYDKALGTQRDKKQKWPPIYYLGPLGASILTACAVAILSSWLDITTLIDAVWLGLVIGAGVALSVSCNNAINPITPRPLMYGLVTGSYHIMGIVLCAVVIELL